jgi:hypothetical protein
VLQLFEETVSDFRSGYNRASVARTGSQAYTTSDKYNKLHLSYSFGLSSMVRVYNEIRFKRERVYYGKFSDPKHNYNLMPIKVNVTHMRLIPIRFR